MKTSAIINIGLGSRLKMFAGRLHLNKILPATTFLKPMICLPNSVILKKKMNIFLFLKFGQKLDFAANTSKN